MKIKIATYDVEIVDKITWGMQNEIRSALLSNSKVSANGNVEMDGAGLIQSKYKAVEVCIVKITDSAGAIVPYTKQWLDNLDVEDGDELLAVIDKVTAPKKK